MNQDGPVIVCKVQFKRGSQGRKRLVTHDATRHEILPGRTPRIAKLVALSIRLNGLIDSGEIEDWADAARLAHVTRARASQIAALTLLAPDIIEELLHLPVIERGRDPITERDLRPIASVVSWNKQRRLWRTLLASRTS